MARLWIAAFGLAALAGGGCRFFLGDEPVADALDPRCGWGRAGLPDDGICLEELPAMPVMIIAGLNTDSSLQCKGYSRGGGSYCVIAGTDVYLRASSFDGTKPLVVLATGSITVEGDVDLSGRLGLAPPSGAQPAGECDPGVMPGGSAAMTRGGAGGSFGGRGGRGGQGNNIAPSTTDGLAGDPVTMVPQQSRLRGGCRGQSSGGVGPGAAIAGFGGGAIYLIAGTEIRVLSAGSINASGGGGDGGATGTPPRGGGGAGSGGMIVLEAPAVHVQGLVFADGGGGGEGADNSAKGGTGKTPTGLQAAAGGSQLANGGDGGHGSHGGVPTGFDAATQATATGGGGGGGAGVIWIRGDGERTGVISPTPVPL